MKKIFTKFLTMAVLAMSALSVSAQQLPDPGFEDWSGTKFEGAVQPKYWHGANVSQSIMNVNFTFQETGRSGKCIYFKNQYVGMMGIGQTSPGYVTLGSPWQYINGMDIDNATGGTDGGISFAHRPDSMFVWIKRNGSKASSEEYSILFYSWKGTAKGTSYKGNQTEGCTDVQNPDIHTNEESDIRQTMDKNKCQTTQQATQVAEGFWFERKQYDNWTQIKVPIYYMNDEVPEMCNVIFSSSGYPNFRNSGNINDGNGLYVDDVELIYSSKIQHLYIGGKRWDGFDPNSSDEQIYSVGQSSEVPEIYAVRGAGTMKNIKGDQVAVNGRKLSGDEISISYGKVDGAATVITVKSGDGKSTTTYKIKMTKAASTNASLNSILVNGEAISGYNQQVTTYNVALPYGTTAKPVVTVVKAEDKQTVSITQATSTTGKATIVVTAADGKTKKTYTINFSIAQLADNTLKGIKVNDEEIADFSPSLTTYRVELPIGTTAMPKVEAISAYPAGAQTITYKAPDKIDGGQYQISVTTPGNQTAKVYKLNFVLTASTNSRLKDLQVAGYDLEFSSTRTTYYVTLPMGTTELPKITWTQGDAYQKVEATYGGVDGQTVITVTAASGAVTKYTIIFKTEKSTATHLNMIYVGGVALDGFNSETTAYTYQLTPGTTELPAITYDKGDDYETVTVTTGGLNGVTKITVKAGDGSTRVYRITFQLELSADVNLDAIYLDGKLLEGFSAEVHTYQITLPKGIEELPTITWKKQDESQTVTVRSNGVNGDTKITVRAQSDATSVYTLQFRVQKDTVNHLEMIYLDKKPLEGFHKDSLNYIDSLPVGVSKIPAVTWDLAAESATAKLLNQGNQRLIRVTAENGVVREYVITFIVRKSETAFLKMINLNGEPLPGFDPKELEYSYSFDGELAPEITVEKDGNQQVIIMAPIGAGVATITVSPEDGGEGNTYIINLHQKPKAAVQLADIQLDGVSMPEFDPAILDYNIDYSDVQPVVTCTAADDRTVTTFAERGVVRFVVVAGEEQAIYTVNLNQLLSEDSKLAAILLNGEQIKDFDPDTLNYALTLPAGSAIPEITYTLNHAAQVATLGQIGEKKYGITVRAEDGTTTTYTIAFDIEVFTTVELEALTLDDKPIELKEGVYTYEQTIDAGAELPELGITPGGGQTILSVNTSDTQQQIIVKSEDGKTETYTINYTPVHSSNALLDSIILGGVALEDFDPAVYNYVDTLPWRSTVVPVIRPIGATPNQVIEVHYGAVNQKTRIHVTAADKVTTADYYIDFPVIKSSNVALESVLFEDVDFDFKPETTDYTIHLPYQTKVAPAIYYKESEPEQSIKFINAPVSEVTKLIVTAENGDQRTYSFAFEVATSDKANALDSLIYTYQTKAMATPVVVRRKLAEDETDLTIDLPYGTTEFNVSYFKNYDEQAVLVEQGGIFNPTVITVKANRGDEADKVYTITPNIEKQNPAVLKSITVNGTPLAGFNPNRFSYVVSVSSVPSVEARDNQGNLILPKESNSKHWQAEITREGITSTYDIWYYYSADVIPNGELNTNGTATYNGAFKPQSWNTIADADDIYEAKTAFITWCTQSSGDECSKASDGSIYLKTRYSSCCARTIPGFMTLAQVSGTLNTTNAFSYSGSIVFRNTPDVLTVRYKAPTIEKNNQIIYQLWGTNGSKNINWQDSEAFGSYVERPIDLTEANEAVGTPTNMNIVLNSYWTTNGQLGTDGMIGAQAEMYVDWLRFTYSSVMSKIKVNDGEDVTPEGNTFNYTLPSAETTGVPELTFIGKVSDQAQLVVWSDSLPKSLTRKATVTNYAEDGTFTQYEIIVTRPKSKIATLADLKVNGQTVTGWDPNVTEYEIPVAFGQKRLYDVQAVHGSNLQTVDLVQGADKVTINVTSENGEKKTYVVTFVEKKSNDVTLKSLTASGVEYDPATTEYEISLAQMPKINFEKKTDGQTVTLDGNKLLVVAEDGQTKSTITITNTPPAVPTSGKLYDLQFNGLTIEGFDPNTFEYENAAPKTTAFTREFDVDVVLNTITPDSVTWKVTGTEGEHTYSVVYPQEISAESNIEAILVNGTPLEGFDPAIPDEYPYYSNDPVRIQVVAKPGQKILAAISVEAIAGAPGRMNAPAQPSILRYTIEVTAENGINTATYILNVMPLKSDNASLSMIRLDGTDLEGFASDQTRYVVTLPAGSPKVSEPKHPAISYIAGEASQAITLLTSQENDTTYNYITVTAADGLHEQTYELLITAEPSHNAEITALMLDGQMVEDFDPARTNYSSWVNDLDVDIAYNAADRFLTVDTTLRGNVLTLHVVAQDKVTTRDYEVKIYPRYISTDVTLADILLNGQSFTDYDPALTPYTPMNSYYTIPISTNQEIPDVRPILNSAEQSAEIDKSHKDTVLVTVQAADGLHTNTYVLFFKKQYSSNTDLARLDAGSSPIELVPGQTEYTFALPVGEKAARPVTFELQNYDQQSSENEVQEGMNWSIDVIAEDGTRVTYKVTFIETLSQNAQLSDITANEQSLEGFSADEYKYSITLPQGDRKLPIINFYAGDQWQRQQEIDTIATTLRTTYACHVLAEDSIHRSTYEVEINILPSDVDTLASITINNSLLEEFDPRQADYVYQLPEDATELPMVEFEKGDEYQTIDTVSTGLNGTMTILVTAENGTQRRYFLHFAVAKNSIDTLSGISYGGKPVDEFNPETYEYTINLPYGEPTIPVVTFTKGNAAQEVTLTQQDNIVTLLVTAANGAQKTYTLTFIESKSTEAHLASITINDEPLAEFKPETFEYEIHLPYGTTEMPQVAATLADTTATMEILTSGQTVTISTLSADERTPYEYIVTFVVEGCPINYLTDLLVRGTSIEGFHQDSLVYTITYPVGSDSTAFAKAADVTYLVGDSTEQVSVVDNEDGSISVTVKAQNGDFRGYTILQEIGLSSNGLLADLTLNGVTIANFSDSVFTYEYLLFEGQNPPSVEAIPQDSLTKVSVTPGLVGEYTTIYCTAQDGSETIYRVLFSVSSINTALDPRSGDVLFKQLPGSDQFAAYSIRVNTFIVIYDHMGRKFFEAALPVCDPNDVTIAQDPTGREILTDAQGDGFYFQVPAHGQTFFYLFHSGGKRISSGKFMVQ